MNIYKGQRPWYNKELLARINEENIYVDDITLNKIKDAISWETREILDKDRPCKGVCDGSCKLNCKNM